MKKKSYEKKRMDSQPDNPAAAKAGGINGMLEQYFQKLQMNKTL